MLAIKLEHFEGPLDLLLHLIEDEKLDITEVSLARIADQYLDHLAQFSDEHRLDELADFIVIAAKLLLIKSRALVPLLAPEEEEEIEELARQLKMYRAFVDAGKKIDALYKRHRIAFPRRAPLRTSAPLPPPPSLTAQVLRAHIARILKAIEIVIEKPRAIIFPARVSIKEKIRHIVALLSRRTSFRFHEILTDAQSRADVVVSFMALLELMKHRSINASQSALFGDIEISRTVPALPGDTRGQTLIEVITALAVIAVGLVGVLTLATSNVRNQGIGLSRLSANNFAREGIEVARNIRDTNWLSGAPWYEGLVHDTGNQCAVISAPRTEGLDFVACPSDGASFFDEPFRLYRNETEAFDEHLQKGSRDVPAGTATAFYRKLELKPICLTATKDAETTTACVFDEDCLDESIRAQKPSCAIGFRVTGEVSWKQSGSDHLVRLRENLYNWR